MLDAPIGTVWLYGGSKKSVYVKVSEYSVDCQSFKAGRNFENNYQINETRHALELLNPEEVITPELIAFIKMVYNIDVICPGCQISKYTFTMSIK